MYAMTHNEDMAEHVSAREARARFAEITDRVRYTGEPVVVEKQGKPFVAVVSVDDLDALERLRSLERDATFVRAGAAAAQKQQGEEPTEEDIVEAVKATRESLYRERYGSN